MTVNVVNTRYEPNKYTAYLPVCRICGQKPCKNCKLPLLGKLEDVINEAVVLPLDLKFKDNANLYLSK